MPSEKTIAAGLFAGFFALVGAFFVLTSVERLSAQEIGPFEDTGGPYLVIQIAGEASGEVVIDLLDDVAPAHVQRIITLAEDGLYDGVAFHRVIEGFMAQTGDVSYGQRDGDSMALAGMGGSNLPDLQAEFSPIPFERGVVGMARSADPDSGNSQFFIMFEAAPGLNSQYTVFGRVISGMEVVDAIRRGNPAANGTVTDPDWMETVTIRY